jgi:hypothetical protein
VKSKVAIPKQTKTVKNKNNMKKLLTLTVLIGATTLSFAQGTVNFANSAATLISAGGVAMPGNATAQFNFAVFLAPSGTAAAGGGTVLYTDPIWQTVAGINNNGTTAGRLVTATKDVGGSPGNVNDFIVRGWSASAGATWAAALASWNNGQPTTAMYIGSSLIGNDIVLGGGALPIPTLFGAGANQIGGFNMALVPAVPEPSSMVLAGLGAASLLLFRRRK